MAFQKRGRGLRSSHFPLSCRTSPPQGGEIGGFGLVAHPATLVIGENRAANLPPCGERPDRTERGGKTRPTSRQLHGQPMLALYLRDLRLGIRAGGGALTGVAVLPGAWWRPSPSASGRTSTCSPASDRQSCGSARCSPRCSDLDRLFQADREDGSLDLLLLSGERHMLALTVLVKCLEHWTASVLPLVVACLLGLFAERRAGGASALPR